MTYYNPALGACGTTHGDNDAVVAISKTICKPCLTILVMFIH